MSKYAHPVKILCLVSYKILPPQTGGQKAILFFYNYLSKLLPVTIVSTKNNEAAAKENIIFKFVLPDAGLRYINPFLFFTLKKIIEKNKITHLIIEHPYYGWLGILLKKFTKTKLIVRSHNIEGNRWRTLEKWWWKILWHYEKYTHQKADHNFFITGNDKNYALKHFGLAENKCTVITYGIEIDQPPSNEEKQQAKKIIFNRHSINTNEKILLFNGTLNYKPNLEAVNVIFKNIHPALLNCAGFKYKIIICGKGLPANYINSKEANIIFTGFVEDINTYYKAADIFINPVIEGGGIKTKVVEALSYNVTVISTASGAKGVAVNVCGKKLIITNDGDWQKFSEEIISADVNEVIPKDFFYHFYWGNIAQKAAGVINNT